MASKVLAAAIRSRYGTPSKASMSAALARLGKESPITRSNGITRDTVLSPRSFPRAGWGSAPYPKPQLTIAVGEILIVRHWWPLLARLGEGRRTSALRQRLIRLCGPAASVYLVPAL